MQILLELNHGNWAMAAQLPALWAKPQNFSQLLLCRSFAWWSGGPKKKGEKKKPKFIRVGESLYRVQNYRLAYRRIFGKDIPMQEQYDFAHRQQHAVEATKARNKSKAASSPPFSRMPDAIIYPYERKKWKNNANPSERATSTLVFGNWRGCRSIIERDSASFYSVSSVHPQTKLFTCFEQDLQTCGYNRREINGVFLDLRPLNGSILICFKSWIAMSTSLVKSRWPDSHDTGKFRNFGLVILHTGRKRAQPTGIDGDSTEILAPFWLWVSEVEQHPGRGSGTSLTPEVCTAAGGFSGLLLFWWPWWLEL